MVGIATKRKLTRMQKTFCDEYIKTGNAYQSAKKAGYKHPESEAYRLLDNARIKNYLQKRTKKVKEKKEIETIATQADAIKALSEMILSGFTTEARAKKTTHAEVDKEGNVTKIEEMTQSLKPNELIRAVEVMSRLQGWENQSHDNELSKVDELLNKMLGSAEDD